MSCKRERSMECGFEEGSNPYVLVIQQRAICGLGRYFGCLQASILIILLFESLCCEWDSFGGSAI